MTTVPERPSIRQMAADLQRERLARDSYEMVTEAYDGALEVMARELNDALQELVPPGLPPGPPSPGRHPASAPGCWYDHQQPMTHGGIYVDPENRYFSVWMCQSCDFVTLVHVP